MNIINPLRKDKRPIAKILWGNIALYCKQVISLNGFRKTRSFIIIYDYPKGKK